MWTLKQKLVMAPDVCRVLSVKNCVCKNNNGFPWHLEDLTQQEIGQIHLTSYCVYKTCLRCLTYQNCELSVLLIHISVMRDLDPTPCWLWVKINYTLSGSPVNRRAHMDQQHSHSRSHFSIIFLFGMWKEARAKTHANTGSTWKLHTVRQEPGLESTSKSKKKRDYLDWKQNPTSRHGFCRA